MRYTNKQLANALVDTVENGKTKLSTITDAIVNLLAKTGETHRLHGIIQAIEKVWKEKYGAATITIETAHPISEATRKKLEKIAFGAQIKEIVNENLIGGARVRVDDRIIDSSLKGRLERLKSDLMKA